MGKARSLPKCEAPEWSSSHFGSGLTHKHDIRLESRAGYKHFSLLLKIVNYGRKKFHNIGPKKNVNPYPVTIEEAPSR